MVEARSNRRILLRKRPSGLLKADDYAMVSERLDDVAAGDAIVETAMLAVDPVTRVMLSADIGVMPPIPLGAAIRGFGAGTVVASKRDDYPVGARVTGFFEWAGYQHIGTAPRAQRLPDHVSFIQALNLYGHTAHAAYFGMIDVGKVRDGDTVVVTGAAGAVGSIAGQIARIKGARVIGTAGTAEKCAWLVSELGFAAAVNYRQGDVGAAIGAAAPHGIDLLFDNVGGALLDGLIDHLAPGARIVLCGAMAQFLDDDPLASPGYAAAISRKGATAARFNAMDYAAQFDAASAEMTRWENEGALKVETTCIGGLDQAPLALNALFEGRSSGGRLLIDVLGESGKDGGR